MARKSIAALAVLGLISLPFAPYVAGAHSRAEMARKIREPSYAKELAFHARDIKPSMLRIDVESKLTSRRVSFFQRSGDRNYDTWIPLGREPSGVWYCGPVLVGVAVSYEPGTGNPAKGKSEDVVHAVLLDRWWDNCL